MTTKFSPEMNTLLNFSKEEAERLHNDSVSPTHLMLALLRQNDNRALNILRSVMPDTARLKSELEASTRKHQVLITPSTADICMDTEATRIMRLCVLEAKLMNTDVIEPLHLLLAIMKADDSEASNILERMNISYELLAQTINGNSSSDDDDNFMEEQDDEEEDGMTAISLPMNKPSVTLTKNQVGKKTPMLDNFGVDLTQAAANGLLDPVIGREKELDRIIQILCRRKKNNPILIGEPGVGKSAIVEGLAQRIVNHHISRSMWSKRLIMLDMANVVAGTKYRGQFEERLRTIIQELHDNPDVIVFIDEIHTIVGAGSAQGTMDAANMLKPALARGEFQCIGSTTTDEFRKTIEKDGALERRFQKILVSPTSNKDTLQILTNLRERYEQHHHVTYTDEALEACVKLTERYVTDRNFPDKAIDAMDEAGSRLHVQDNPVPARITELEQQIEELKSRMNEAVENQNFELAADYRDQVKKAELQLQEEQKNWEQQQDESRQKVDENIVAEVVSLMTGVPLQHISQEENQKLRDMKSHLQQRVIGQDEAISTLVRSIQRSRIGLKDPKRPIGTFMFVGPTGVGKTYLTKCLAEEMFGSPDSIIRIDMSEYMEKHTVSRMVGAPPGYVGYEEGGQLTEKVRRKPYSIVLLDEIEKAHTDVFNMLLQVMDEGRLTDGNGNTVDFKNTIVIMTSNCGTKQVSEFGNGVGFQSAGTEIDKQLSHDLVKKALKKQFAPEFLNRLDDIVYFDQLDKESIQKIVNIELSPLLKRLQDIGIHLTVTDEACHLLGEKGYDVKYGARPLKRVIQNMIEDPMCEILMNRKHKKNLSALVVDDKITIK